MTATIPSVCTRCTLRIANKRTPSLYALPPPPLTAPAPPPCSLCLGILQEPALSAVLSQLHLPLSRIAHDGRFKINAALPVSAALLRDRAARIAPAALSRKRLRARHGPAHVPDVSLREAVKWAVCARIRDVHGAVYAADAPLFVDVRFAHPETDAESVAFAAPETGKVREERGGGGGGGKSRRLGGVPSGTVVARVVEGMSDEQFRAAAGEGYFPPPSVETGVSVSVHVAVAPVLFAGSYVKLSRAVSQTPWFVDAPRGEGLAGIAKGTGGAELETDGYGRQKRTAVSVEDVVTSGIVSRLKPGKATFTAGGREDVDVRMLGSGRPFVVEVVDSTVVPSLITKDMVREMAAVSAKMSESVIVRDLRVVSKDYFAQMRMFESEKRKHYRCVVWTRREVGREELVERLEKEGGFMLYQKTPLRVLHRRTQAVRQRRIFEAHVTRLVAPNFFVLDVVAAAGTYIKEFVHGDNGRTVPNVAMLLDCDADIVQLDVTEIHRGGADKEAPIKP